MRAFFHPDQHLHNPRTIMRYGRMTEAKDLPSRVEALLRALAERGIAAERPADAGREPALTVHTRSYLDFLDGAFERWRDLPEAGPEVMPHLSPYWSGRPDQPHRPPCRSSAVVAQAGYYLGDCGVPVGPDTFRSALASTHSATAAADAVLAGDRLAYALCRPSGHHARADRASGYCYLNNSAIVAERLASRFGRVAILDVDAHHGDGTQEIFYRRNDVLTVSIHVDPDAYYPFYTGYADERGLGAGEGFNLNLPLAPGSGDDVLFAAMAEGAAAIRAFRPGALVVPLGFDTHRDDPIGLLDVSTGAFRGIGERVAALGLPTVVVQEGGYQVDVIGDCLGEFLDGLMGR